MVSLAIATDMASRGLKTVGFIAVLVAASGTPAVLPERKLRERGYEGKYYQTHGVANNDFLRVGGKDVEGTYLPAGPVLVASAIAERSSDEGQGNGVHREGRGDVWKGIGLDLRSTCLGRRPAHERGRCRGAEKGAARNPGIRAALRDALESLREVHGAHGVFNMSTTDHLGLDQRARVMVKIENGA